MLKYSQMKNENNYDQNIISALKALPNPLKTFDGHCVLFDVNKRNETIFEHIANKKHHLFLKDIEIIPKILMDKSSLQQDNKSNKFHNYVGKRAKKNERNKHLKIITEVKRGKKESIVTIYTIR